MARFKWAPTYPLKVKSTDPKTWCQGGVPRRDKTESGLRRKEPQLRATLGPPGASRSTGERLLDADGGAALLAAGVPAVRRRGVLEEVALVGGDGVEEGLVVQHRSVPRSGHRVHRLSVYSLNHFFAHLQNEIYPQPKTTLLPLNNNAECRPERKRRNPLF